jgi:hypothetical protein
MQWCVKAGLMPWSNCEKDKEVVVLDADLSNLRWRPVSRETSGQFFMLVFRTGYGQYGCWHEFGGKIPLSLHTVFFIGRAWDQIRNTVCYSNLNVEFVERMLGSQLSRWRDSSITRRYCYNSCADQYDSTGRLIIGRLGKQSKLLTNSKVRFCAFGLRKSNSDIWRYSFWNRQG